MPAPQTWRRAAAASQARSDARRQAAAWQREQQLVPTGADLLPWLLAVATMTAGGLLLLVALVVLL